MNELALDSEFGQAVEAVRAATLRMMIGDSGPWKALLSSRDDLVLLGAWGGHDIGPSAAAARLDGAATAWDGGGGGDERLEIERLATWSSTDLACTVELNRHHGARVAGHAPTTIAYRVTHVFRREPDGWKVVLRHADPLVEPRRPELVLPLDQ
jgi:ketosteroid isomerase-like protein